MNKTQINFLAWVNQEWNKNHNRYVIYSGPITYYKRLWWPDSMDYYTLLYKNGIEWRLLYSTL